MMDNLMDNAREGNDIAIIGISCRFPGAENYNDYWRNLKRGVNSIREIPPERWSVDDFYSPDINEPNRSVSKWCGILDDIDKFDNGFFNISPREANNMDPQQRLLLEETWHCIEDSGVSLKTLQSKITSVYVGVMAVDYRQEALAQNVETDSYACLGNYECILANRLSYMYDFRGASMVINAACASSLVAIHDAKRALLLGECDYAFAGGVNLNFHPWKYISFSKSRMLSPDGQCKTFDKDANGYVPGDGIGIILLQRLEDAVRSNNHIYGVIKGSGMNHSGKTLSITAPRVESQRDVILAAYEDAGISPESVTYIEAHGTGTSLGDPIEIEALTKAFRKFTNISQFCKVGSVKTNIGHLEAAAGVAGVIKVLMMMKYRKIPPSLNIKVINPIIDFEKTPFSVVTMLTEWKPKKDGIPLRAGISSFGFGGVNSHVLIEEYRNDEVKEEGSSTNGNIFTLSAKTPGSLKKLLKRWRPVAESESFTESELSDACNTLLNSRESFRYRFGKFVKSKEELISALDNNQENSIFEAYNENWCLMIGKSTWKGYREIRRLAERWKIFGEVLLKNIKLLDQSNKFTGLAESFMQEFWDEKNIDAYSFIANFTYTKAMAETGIRVDAVTGQGKGIWTAMTFSGMLKFEDTAEILCGKNYLSQLKVSRPKIPFYDWQNQKYLMPLQVDEDYVRFLVDELSIQNKVLNKVLIDGNISRGENYDETLIGTLLIHSGAINETQLNEALQEQQTIKKPLGAILMKKKSCTQYDVKKALRQQQILRGNVNEVLAHYTDKARILNTSQFTFKKLVSEWDSVIKQVSGHDIVEMLHDEKLLAPEEDKFQREKLLLLIVIMSSLRKLNQKWSLEEHKLLEEERFYELLDLVTDEVISKEMLVSFLTSNNPDLSEIAKVINEHQNKVVLSNKYKLLKSINKNTLDSYDVQNWIKHMEADNRTLLDENSRYVCLGGIFEYGSGQKPVFIMRQGDEIIEFEKDLLELWLNGFNIKWDKVYNPETFKKVSLPGYVFETGEFWLPTTEGNCETGQVQKLHPLIDINVSNLDEQKFSVKLTGKEFYLKNHVVDNNLVLPGVVYLEMARAAGDMSSKYSVSKMKNIVWSKPVIINSDYGEKRPVEVFISLYPQEQGVLFDIWHSDEMDRRVVNSSGTIVFDEQECSKDIYGRVDIEAIKSRCLSFKNGDECYIMFKDLGFNYGVDFQPIKEFYSNERESLSELQLSAYLVKDFDKYVLHPSIMDGALQTAVALLADTSDLALLYLPYAISTIEILKPLPMRCYVYTSVTERQDLAGLVKFNTDLLNDEGEVLVRISNISFKASRKHINGIVSRVGYFYSVWEQAPHLPDTTSYTALGDILLFDMDEKLANELKEKCCGNSKKSRIVLVMPGNEFKDVGNLCYLINPSKPDEYGKLLRDISGKGIELSNVIHFWSREGFQCSEEALGVQLERGIYSVFFFSKALIEQKLKENIQMLYAFNGGHSEVQPQYGAVSGFAKTIFLENPKFIIKTIEISSNNEQYKDSYKIASDILMKELLSKSTEGFETRYEDNFRYLKNFKPYENFDITGKSLVAKDSGVYLITGGLGGLGLIFAEYLARKARVKLVLTGRSDLDVARKEKIKKLEAMGSEVLYIKSDVSKKTDVENLFKQVKTRFERVDGVIHCAGIIRDAYVLKKTKEEIDAVLAAKVYGTIALDEITKNEKLDYFILFSSTTSALGNIGQSDYAYANGFMDIYAELREKKNRPGKTLAINWPLWKDGGMNVREEKIDITLKDEGIVPLHTETGLKAFEEGLKADKTQFMVLEGDMDKIRKNIDKYNEGRSVANKQYSQVENGNTELLKEKTEAYLKRIVSKETGYPIEKVQSNQHFDKYGIDSVMVMNLTRALEADFGDLSKTLFFEYQSISELADYFVANYQDTLIKKMGMYNDTKSESELKEELPTEKDVFSRNRFNLIAKTCNDEIKGYSSTAQLMDIAIIGVSGRYPMADNLEEFWDNLKNGKDCITEIPENRWDGNSIYDPERRKKGKSISKWGGFINDIDKFDPLFFNISPREAELMDPQERLFMETVWHTLEDSGYAKSRLERKKIGVFVGVMYGQYQLYSVERKGFLPWAFYASIANRVSYHFNFNGPSIAIDTMCSSSLTSIHLACNSIRNGESEYAIAGGVNLSIHPNKYLFLSEWDFVSSDGRCRSFGEGGDGYVPGEGVGAILLKPLDKALEDGDRIYAVVKGTAVNHGGKANGFTVPNPNVQAEVISEAIKQSGINPRTISYIEAHGTGTPLGDPIEVAGLSKAFGEYCREKNFCSIGSAKSNIGHLEAAAGIAGVTKVLLQMKYKQLVPSIHSDNLNPNVSFENSPFFIQHGLSDWKQPSLTEGGVEKKFPRRAGISSFGAGGSNAHVILEEYVNEQKSTAEDMQPCAIILSAKNKDRLKAYAGLMADYISKHRSGMSITNVAYTLQVGREAMEERIAFTASSIDEVVSVFKSFHMGSTPNQRVYEGSIKAGNFYYEEMLEGEEGKEFIKAVIQSRKINKMAQLWVIGAEIDWSMLWVGNNLSIVSLPVYPFKGQRYWAPEQECTEIGMNANGQIAKLHPMVDANTSTFKELKFSSEISESAFYISDRTLGGRKEFPQLALLELARAAGELAGEKKVLGIENVVWANQVFLFKDKRKVHISLYSSGGKTYYEIFSDGDGSRRIIHSQGCLVYELKRSIGAFAGDIDFETIKKKAIKKVQGEGIYRRLQEVGYNYKSQLRCIKEIHGGSNEILAQLILSEIAKENVEGFKLHPTVLESIFQVVLLMLEDREASTNGLYIPYKIDTLDIIGNLYEASYVHAVLLDSKADEGLPKIDVKVLDKKGNILMRIKNFMTRLSKPPWKTMQKGNKNDFLDLLNRMNSGEISADEVERYIGGGNE